MSRSARTLRINRLQTRAERQMERELRGLFKNAIQQSVALARRGLDPSELEESLQQRLRTVLRRSYRRVMVLARDEVYQSSGASEGKDISDVFEEIAEGWIAEQVGLKIVTISQAFTGSVRDVIARSFEEGLGQEETARQIRKTVGQEYTQWRAARIARTEMAAATNQGSDAAARSTGLDMVKEWSSADDARTRPTHAAADGQVREMDEPFQVGDYQLMHPGDPSGPAGEVINCRCVTLYHPRVAGEILR